jgi:ankyrin repeat protein
MNAEKFCEACIAGNLLQVKEMLAAEPAIVNASGTVREDHRQFMKKNNSEGGWTALHLAAHYGQSKIVQELIAKGADLNALSKNGEANTPLMAAVAGGDIGIVGMLLEAGADPLKLDASGKFHAVRLAEVDKKPEISALFSRFLQA